MCNSIIVKFTSFRYRTKAYRQKKNLDDGVTAHVDLTSRQVKADEVILSLDELNEILGEQFYINIYEYTNMCAEAITWEAMFP